jgi:hypothetical protein
MVYIYKISSGDTSAKQEPIRSAEKAKNVSETPDPQTPSKYTEYLEAAGTIALYVVLAPLFILGIAGCERDERSIAISKLKKAGIYNDYEEVLKDFMPDSPRTKTEYMNALIDLHDSGIALTYNRIYALRSDKAANQEYVNALKTLHKAGVTINEWIIDPLSIENAKMPEYIDALIKLQRAGIDIADDRILVGHLIHTSIGESYGRNIEPFNGKLGGDWFVLLSLEPEKAKDPDFINALITLHKNGVQISGWLVNDLRIDQARDPRYLEKLIKQKWFQ